MTTYQVVATGIIGPVERLAVAGVDEEVLGALGKAVASVEAKLAEQGHFLQVDNHVLHQLKLADHLFLLFGKFRSTDYQPVTQNSENFEKKNFERIFEVKIFENRNW